MNNKEAVFPDISTLISHLKFLKGKKLTPIRLQKALYFLFAFYGATYGQLNSEVAEEGLYEGTEEDAYPSLLFNENFEAWKFGPVIPTVYRDFKRTEIDSKEWESNDPKGENVKHLIKEVMDQLDDMGDFELVERTHEDESWKEAYKEGQSTKMNHTNIINEYRTPVA